MALSLLMPQPTLAQQHVHDQPPWIEDVGVAGANLLLGGATAAVTAWIRGEPVGDGFLNGALGGGLGFIGKRVAVEEFPGAGLLGRQVAAVGASMVVNAGTGQGPFAELWLPVGPVWLQAIPSAGHRARLDAGEVATLLWAATRNELELDGKGSLSNGAFIFRSPGHYLVSDGRRVDGLTIGGIVALGPSYFEPDHIRGHEMVHVIQNDFMVHAWSRPLESWGWRLLIGREIPVDVVPVPLKLLTGWVTVNLREGEAQVLEFR